jgi:serine/threonine-protein kinase HipA
MDRVAYVYFNDLYVGKIYETSEGFNFVYDSNYILTGTPIGFNYPFKQTKYFSQSLFPIFENLVSEGWLLNLQSKMQHIDKKDKLGILINNGKDLIGAITILKEVL